MSVEQSIKSKASQASIYENKAVIMLDCPVNRSNAFDVRLAEPLFEFSLCLLIPVVINIPQWNCCFGNMGNVLHLMGDTDCEDLFKMNMDMHWESCTVQESPPFFCTLTPFTWFVSFKTHGIPKLRGKKFT